MGGQGFFTNASNYPVSNKRLRGKKNINIGCGRVYFLSFHAVRQGFGVFN
jgi:hypothetical protein